jgi:glutamate synthase (ferredoxin)
MTGGRAVILGETGKNFAAGMSGGIAYVYDKNNTFEQNLNKEMVEFDELNEVYENEIKTYVEKHFNYTGSVVAKEILNNWETEKQNFKVIIAPEFKKLFERGEA